MSDKAKLIFVMGLELLLGIALVWLVPKEPSLIASVVPGLLAMLYLTAKALFGEPAQQRQVKRNRRSWVIHTFEEDTFFALQDEDDDQDERSFPVRIIE